MIELGLRRIRVISAALGSVRTGVGDPGYNMNSEPCYFRVAAAAVRSGPVVFVTLFDGAP